MIIGLLWIAQVALFAVGWFGPWRDAPERDTNGRLAWPVRMGLSLSLVVAAFLIWSGRTAEAAAYSRWVLLGMMASFAGDLIMARLLPVPNRLIGGMAAFGVAHALYITAYVSTVRLRGAAVASPGLWLGLIAYGTATVSGWWFLIRNPAREPIVNVGALVYGLWIGLMASFALALGMSLGGGWWLAALGGLLFVGSDLLIGVTDIRGLRLTNANDWIWLTYVAGQMGIIYAPWLSR
ncbi:MAG: lysoplasmalogenase [Candidatus Binatia bacterium]